MNLPEPISLAIQHLGKLPGVGDKTAQRYVFSLLGSEPAEAHDLGAALAQLHRMLQPCETCGNFATDSQCAICLDTKRDDSVLCCVARVQDLYAIERAEVFRGRYHVLAGLLEPLDGMGPADLPLDALVARCKDGVEEVIVATPMSVAGQATALYVKQTLEPEGVRVTRPASGLPHGGELEMADQMTVGAALEHRQDV